MFDPAASPTTQNCPANASTTAKVCRPIDPVQPSIEIFFMLELFGTAN
jgi:hypothetical protein